METKRKPIGKLQPDYKHLYGIACHAIHVSESLHVTTETMEGILAQYDDFLRQNLLAPTMYSNAVEDIHRQLVFYKNGIASFRYWLRANKDCKNKCSSHFIRLPSMMQPCPFQSDVPLR